jgi:hypothetical protein
MVREPKDTFVLRTKRLCRSAPTPVKTQPEPKETPPTLVFYPLCSFIGGNHDQYIK